MAVHIILSGIISMILAQGIKVAINIIKNKPGALNPFDTGDMPSSHSTTVASMCTSVCIETGPGPLFGACVLISMIILRDALGLRRTVGKHSKMLNEKLKASVFKENIGHKFSQVSVGVILGIAFTIVYYKLIGY
jgi:acid phosphatase family membrane protein YuiD